MVLVKFETPPGFVAKNADERNFYFAVKDWYIRGSCYCHGQSAQCNTQVIYDTWKWHTMLYHCAVDCQ